MQECNIMHTWKRRSKTKNFGENATFEFGLAGWDAVGTELARNLMPIL